jgi:hypothetical protein
MVVRVEDYECRPKFLKPPFSSIVELICKVTLSFTRPPIPSHPLPSPPLCQWYRQSKNIKRGLSMKCWNSAFNAQGSRVIVALDNYHSSITRHLIHLPVGRSELLHLATLDNMMLMYSVMTTLEAKWLAFIHVGPIPHCLT